MGGLLLGLAAVVEDDGGHVLGGTGPPSLDRGTGWALISRAKPLGWEWENPLGAVLPHPVGVGFAPLYLLSGSRH